MRFSIIKKIFIGLMGLISLSVVAQRNIVLVDVSGSVDGYGWRSENLLPLYKTQLEVFAPHKDITIIPFGESVYSEINKSDIATLKPHRGNTNIAQAFAVAASADSLANLFILTDGIHNSGVSQTDFLKSIRDLKERNRVGSKKYYFVALSDNAKKSDMASVFNGQNGFILLDSLYFPSECDGANAEKQPTALEGVNDETPSNTNKTKAYTISWGWLWILLIIVLLGGSIYLVYKKPEEFSLIVRKIHDLLYRPRPKPDLSSVGEDIIPSGHGGINKERRTVKQICNNPITKECAATAIKNLEKAGVNKSKAREIVEAIAKQVATKTIVSRGEDLDKAYKKSITVKLGKDKDYVKLIDENPDKDPAQLIRAKNYDIMRQAIAEQFGISKNAAAQLIGDLDLVIHEGRDRIAKLMPNNIHKYFRHSGFVAKIKGRLIQIADDD